MLLFSGGSMLGLAIAVPALKQKLPWKTADDRNAQSPETVSVSGPAEVKLNHVDPETVPGFTAVYLARKGFAQWTAALAEFDGHGPKPSFARLLAPPGQRFEALKSTPGVSEPG